MNSARISLLFVLFLIACNFLAFSQDKTKRPKVGVVLSGGGAKGFAHIGALKVLVEAGVPIDYIGGTSMGGIIGGLFALGYHPDSLEKIVLQQNWPVLLSDEISRRNLTMKEKEQEEKYFFSLPIKERKIQLPTGLIAGQSIFNLLSYYGSPASKFKNFGEFPIPFLCIAANIENGESIILDSGPFATALRATMAIPTVFSPVEINGHLLVDGGLVNNYPAEEVRNMGAEVIIGIDVQGNLYSKEELNSFIRILNQSSAFLRRPMYEKGLAMTDIYIKPDLEDFSISSFTSADTIIKRGEKAARKILPEIYQLLDLLRQYDDFKPAIHEPASPIEKLFIQEVVIEGVKKIPPTFINSHLQIEIPDSADYKTIIRNIEKLYASKNFNFIHYYLTPLQRGGYRFTLQISEKPGTELRVGINYNSDLKAALLVNTTFRNFNAPNDRLSLSLDLGDNSGFEFDYLIDRGWKPGLGAAVKGYSFDVPIYAGENKIAAYTFSSFATKIYSQSNIYNFSNIGCGIEMEYSSMRSAILSVPFNDYRHWNFNIFGFLKVDDLNRKILPGKGRKFEGEIKLVTNVKDTLDKKAPPALFVTCRYLQAIPVNNKLTIIPEFGAGALWTEPGVTIPKYEMYSGGLTDKFGNGLFTFTGLEFMQIRSRNVLIGRIDLQYEVMNNLFAIAKWNLGFFSQDFNKILTENQAVNGYGLSLGLRTPIGPIGVTMMRSDYHRKWLGYFNLGYLF